MGRTDTVAEMYYFVCSPHALNKEVSRNMYLLEHSSTFTVVLIYMVDACE